MLLSRNCWMSTLVPWKYTEIQSPKKNLWVILIIICKMLSYKYVEIMPETYYFLTIVGTIVISHQPPTLFAFKLRK